MIGAVLVASDIVDPLPGEPRLTGQSVTTRYLPFKNKFKTGIGKLTNFFPRKTKHFKEKMPL
jgi:hypothetical protein